MSEPTADQASAEAATRGDLRVAPELAAFVEDEALPGTGVEAEAFWTGLSALVHDFGPRNAALLARRDALQAEIDAWHIEERGGREAYKAFLARSATCFRRATTSRSRPRTSTPRSPAFRGRSWSCRSPTPAMR